MKGMEIDVRDMTVMPWIATKFYCHSPVLGQVQPAIPVRVLLAKRQKLEDFYRTKEL